MKFQDQQELMAGDVADALAQVRTDGRRGHDVMIWGAAALAPVLTD